MITHKPIKDQVAHHLHFWRRARHLSQAELARRVGVSVRTIIRIERSEANPTIEVVERIALVLERDLDLRLRARPKPTVLK